MTSFGEKVLQITDLDLESTHRWIHGPLDASWCVLWFSLVLVRYGPFGPQIPVLFSYGPQIPKFCREPYHPVHGSLDYTATSVHYHRAELAV